MRSGLCILCYIVYVFYVIITYIHFAGAINDENSYVQASVKSGTKTQHVFGWNRLDKVVQRPPINAYDRNRRQDTSNSQIKLLTSQHNQVKPRKLVGRVFYVDVGAFDLS